MRTMTRLHVPVPLRWSDLDAYQHVNNVAMFRLLEDARITAFWRHPDAADGEAWPTAILDTGPHATSHTFVAGQQIEYLRPLGFSRTPVRVEMWIGAIGGASLEVCYEVYDGAPGGFPRTGPASLFAIPETFLSRILKKLENDLPQPGYRTVIGWLTL
jgi:acyl-CoA thioester hydrolase